MTIDRLEDVKRKNIPQQVQPLQLPVPGCILTDILCSSNHDHAPAKSPRDTRKENGIS